MTPLGPSVSAATFTLSPPTDTQLRRINDARRTGLVNLRIADELLTKMGSHQMAAIWWPDV